MSPGVYIRERDKSGAKRRGIVPSAVPITGNGGGELEVTNWYYIYSTYFSNTMSEYPLESGSIGKVWISGSSFPSNDSFLYIKNDNTLWASGLNTYGELGVGDKLESPEIKQVGNDTWKQTTIGHMAAAGITTDGKLYTWGSNDRQQLGTGSLVESLTPIWVAQDSIWKCVSVGAYQTLAVKSDGTLWSWGEVSNGELGVTESVYYTSNPAYYYDENNSPSSLDVYSGTYPARFRWQNGYQIYLGRRLQNDAYLSASIKEIAIFTTELTDVQGKAFRQEMIDRFPLAGGPATQSLNPIIPEYWWRADEGLTTSAWNGSNGNVHFELNNVTTANATDGVVFNGVSSFGISSVLAQDINAKHVFIRFDNLDVNDRGTFLGGTQGNIHEIYFQPGGNDSWFIVENLSNGSLYAAETFFGEPAPSQVIWVDFTNYTNRFESQQAVTLAQEPIQVGTESDWESVYAFDRVSFAIKTDGSLYGWGRNNEYTLAQPNRFGAYYTPVLVDVGPWKKLTSDGFTVYAIKQDGTLWGWGSNAGGSISSGVAQDEGLSGAYDSGSLIPGGSFNAEPNTSVRIITTAGSATTSSISNTLLGSGSLTMSEEPDVGGNDDGYWQINLPFPIEYNGTVYNTIYVGTNSYITFDAGFDDYYVDAEYPDSNKLYISAVDNYCYRIYYGQEGSTYRIRFESNSEYTQEGDPKQWEVVFYENTPNQIDVHVGDNGNWKIISNFRQETPLNMMPGTTWKDISISVYGEVVYEAGGAIKSDGTLWMWGYNDLGQLGFGDFVDRPLPTQLGSDTNWYSILRGVTKNIALKG